MTTLPPVAQRRGHLIALIEARLDRGLFYAAAPLPDEDLLVLPREVLLTVARFLRDDRDAQLDLLVDLCAWDRLDFDGEIDGRFAIVVRLRSVRLGYRARLVVPVPEEDPTFPSLTAVYPVADWYEREIYDLVGLQADGHASLRRLLLYPGFAGHPLRHDYPAEKAQPIVPMYPRENATVVVERAPSTPHDPPREGGG